MASLIDKTCTCSPRDAITSATDETLDRAHRLVELVHAGDAGRGMHRRTIVERLSLTAGEYRTALRLARAAGLVALIGRGASARVVPT